MSGIVVVCASRALQDPRPRRTIELAESIGRLDAIIDTTDSIPGKICQHFQLQILPLGLHVKLLLLILLVATRIKRYGFSMSNRIGEIIADRVSCSIDHTFEPSSLIFVEDAILLPWAFRAFPSNRIVFDAREFYQGQGISTWRWNITKGKMLEIICQKYLKRCFDVITISEDMAKLYFKRYGVKCQVVLSVPWFRNRDLAIGRSDEQIQIVYHGLVNRTRSSHFLIELAKKLDSRFSIHLYMVGDRKYLDRIHAKMRKQIQQGRIMIHEPVAFEAIIETLADYDVGLAFFPPKSINLELALPNKFFEYCAAGLAIAIGPSRSMKEIGDRIGCLIESQSFEVQDLAQTLNKLSKEDVERLKESARTQRKAWCFEAFSTPLRELIEMS